VDLKFLIELAAQLIGASNSPQQARLTSFLSSPQVLDANFAGATRNNQR
jgi:hypothetical protein